MVSFPLLLHQNQITISTNIKIRTNSINKPNKDTPKASFLNKDILIIILVFKEIVISHLISNNNIKISKFREGAILINSFKEIITIKQIWYRINKILDNNNTNNSSINKIKLLIFNNSSFKIITCSNNIIKQEVLTNNQYKMNKAYQLGENRYRK